METYAITEKTYIEDYSFTVVSMMKAENLCKAYNKAHESKDTKKTLLKFYR